jgi:poly(3-hydroxybutyrate) depolymerase
MIFQKQIQLVLLCVLSIDISTIWASPTVRHAASLPTGCGRNLPSGQMSGGVANVSITSNGYNRSYLVFIPPRYNEFIPASVIISYHGGDRNALDQLELDEFTRPYYNTRSIVVYPQGIKVRYFQAHVSAKTIPQLTFNQDTWQGVPGVDSNDIQFTADILSQVQSEYCIDLLRIYASGKSDGAGFVNFLACDPELSTRIAAFAPVSGAYYVDTLPCYPETVTLPCSPGRSFIPLLAFHGGNDTTIPYNGEERKGECLPAIPHFIQEWASREDLGTTNVTKPTAQDTVMYSYGSGLQSGQVGLYYESNIGHDWPSTVPNADNQVKGHHVANYNATPIILDFFTSHILL